MKNVKKVENFSVHPGWRLLLRDLGLEASHVLRRAGLPEDLFSRPQATLQPAEYFALWRSIDEGSGDRVLPLEIGQAISVEAFDAPIFAALCSPDLETAVRRISRYKPLIGPMALHVRSSAVALTIEVEWLHRTEEPPAALTAFELVFFVQLARLATRERIVPLALASPLPPEPSAAYEQYFGLPVERGSSTQVTFTAVDAQRPFLTANEPMWDFFQPELRRRLSELEETASMAERVHCALLDLLPGGEASLAAVAKKLALSTRTLQRRLQAEGKSFQAVLDSTREGLARHYLASSRLSGSEISFLLGFEDPNSFFRAFHAWTGQTPETLRGSSAAH